MQGFADRGAADGEPIHQIPFGGKAVSGPQLAAADHNEQAVADFVRELAADDRLGAHDWMRIPSLSNAGRGVMLITP